MTYTAIGLGCLTVTVLLACYCALADAWDELKQEERE